MVETKIAVAGAAGRMGRALIEACATHPDVRLVAALEHEQSAAIGKDAHELLGLAGENVVISANVRAAVACSDVLIDFTTPTASLKHLSACRSAGVRHVIGTTGFDDVGKAAIADAAQYCGVVFAPNMSVGVNVVFQLLSVAAKVLSEGYDVEILEAHHRHKVDAPSGTALRMGEIVADALGRSLKDCALYGREGLSEPRRSDTIGFATVRAGDIVGDHTVMFAGIGERVEISHRATSRAVFAQGAVRAARWLTMQPPGLYDMQDVLGFKR